MKHILIITSFLLLFSGVVQAQQWPTVQELIDAVEANYHPIDSLHVAVMESLYYAPPGSADPPEDFAGSSTKNLVYIYPDTTIESRVAERFSSGDTLYIIHDSWEGNYVYDWTVIRTPDSILYHSDRNSIGPLTGSDWAVKYGGAFSARMLFQFADYLSEFDSASVIANPEPDVYVIRAIFHLITDDPIRPDIHNMEEIYVDYTRGTIIEMKIYDIGTYDGSIDNPEYGSHAVLFDFEQVSGIWFPRREIVEGFYLPSSTVPGRGVKEITLFTTINVHE